MAWMLEVGQGIMQIAGAENQKTAEKYNAMVQQENGVIAEMKGQLSVEELNRTDRYEQGAARAAYAGSGVTFTGSPMDELAAQSISDSFKKDVAYFNAVAGDTGESQSEFLAKQYQMAGYAEGASTIGSDLINKFYTPGKDDTKDKWGGIPYG